MRDSSRNAPRKFLNIPQVLREASQLHLQGRLDEAEQGFRLILEADGNNFEALHRLGLIRVGQGRMGAAFDLLRKATKLNRQSADAEHSLAVALSGLKRHTEALPHYRRALELRSDFAEAHNNLGHSLETLGKGEEAITHYRAALALRAQFPEASNNLGNALQSLAKFEEATQSYEAAIAQRPDYFDALRSLARALCSQGRNDEAITRYGQALALRPDDLDSHLKLAGLFRFLMRYDEAQTHFEKARDLSPDCIAAHVGLGETAHDQGRSEEAILQFEKALSIDSSNAAVWSRLGVTQLALGRKDAAYAALERAVETKAKGAGHYWNLAFARRFEIEDRHFVAMKQLLRKVDRLTADEQIDLHFALGKAFADVGEDARSFEHLLKANGLKRQKIDYDEALTLGGFERIKRTFTAPFLRERSGLGDSSTVPVFIVGMPRSGTTLIEQVLSSHPRVFGAGELRTVGRIADSIQGPEQSSFPESIVGLAAQEIRRLGEDHMQGMRKLAPNAERITDKMPANFQFVGLIHMLLPEARIIHACRDVRDVALSCFSLMFGHGQAFAYDLAELGRYCRGYLGLMDHWRQVLPGKMLDVHYEDMVNDFEAQARRVVAFCGLEWNDACLDFHLTERRVNTASMNQVRRPIYQSSIGRWRAHEEAFAPFLKALGEEAPVQTGSLRVE